MPQITIIADDLTGAADTGSSFAAAGFMTVIPLAGVATDGAEVIACSTESRDLDADEAARAFAAVVTHLPIDASPWLYKKIDSALRGHPRDELLALMAMTGERRAVVAPAIPAQGRTTAGGRQYVDGVPLERSHLGGHGGVTDLTLLFANDRFPVCLIDLATIRAGAAAIEAAIRERAQIGIVIADGETDADLSALAEAVTSSRIRLLGGAAGFAQQLAFALPLRPAVGRQAVERRSSGPILVVAGSRHAATARQIARALDAGARVVTLPQAVIDDPKASIEDTVNRVVHELTAGATVVLTTAGLSRSPHGRDAVAERLADVAAAADVRDRIGGLILTGGDVAAKTCTALGAAAIRLAGDIHPGIPWGRLDGGVLPGIPIATKAGSFGRDDALAACIAHLSNLPAAAPTGGRPAEPRSNEDDHGVPQSSTSR